MPYLPAHDTLTDVDVMRDFVAAQPLASIVTYDGTAPDLDLVPLLWEASETSPSGLRLIGHVARSNPLWLPGRQQGPVLAVFGPVDHYVSPTWYPSKAEHHRVVPTWNYLVVHARGELVVHDDPRWVRGAVAKLTTAMEGGREVPWRMGQAPDDYLADMLIKIVGITIEVESLVGKFKVSAHRSEADRLGARDGIAAESDASITRLVDAMGEPPQGTF